MIRYIYGSELHQHPDLARSMFRDRAEQFKIRLGWDVRVDEQGEESDEYDSENPLYVIWEEPTGRHGGSMRLLPTTGRTMVNDHFSDLVGGGHIQSPLIWECTRFCIGPDAKPGVAAALMLAGGEVMRGFGIAHYVGVFDTRMVRIYRRIGACPEIVGQRGEGREMIAIGFWEYTPAVQSYVSQRSGISLTSSRNWFESSFALTKFQDSIAA